MPASILKTFLEKAINEFIESDIFKILLILGKPAEYNKKNHLLKLLKEMENNDENIYIIFLDDFNNSKEYFEKLIDFIINQFENFQEVENIDGINEIHIFKTKYKEELGYRPSKTSNTLLYEKFFLDLQTLLEDKIGFSEKILILLEPSTINLKEDFRDSLFKIVTNNKIKKIKFIIIEKNNQNIFSVLDSNLIKKMMFPFDEDSILDFLLKTSEISREEIGIDMQVQIYLAIANIHLSKRNWDQMYEYYYKSLDLIEESGNKKDKAIILSNIGTAHYMNNKPDEALEFYDQSFKVSNEANLTNLSIHSLNCTALVHIGKKNLDRSIEIKLKAVGIAHATGEYQTEASILGDIGILYYRKTEYSEAIEYINKSLILAKEKEMDFEYSKQLKNLAKIYEKINDLNESKIHLAHAQDIEKEKGFNVLSDFDLNPDL